ncbi:hypothetical protein [Hymenobacter sp. UYP22]|uniref:hypothetical protein n=1 Tax=Hymenobacter sp. UYP22 TaxID=3156348 RepID=UPI003395E91B
MYQLQIIARQRGLVEQIGQGTHLELLLLGVYQREWLVQLREAQHLPLSRHYRPKVQQALARLETLGRQAHALGWEQQREQLLEAADLLR